MVFVYVDESGDLGFSGKSSRVFVVGYLACDDPLILQRSLKRIRRNNLNKSMRKLPELKFYTASDRVKCIVFKRIAAMDISYGYMAVNKSQVNDNLRDRKDILYNYFVRQLLDDVITFYNNEHDLSIVMDKPYSNRNLRFALDDYLTRMISRRTDSKLKIEHEDSCKCAGIQFVDFIAGTVRKYYETQDKKYLENLKFATKKELFF